MKNITEPVRVLRVMLDGGVATHTAAKITERSLRKHWRGGVFSLAGLALIAAVIVFVQHLSLLRPAINASIPPMQGPALQLPDQPSIAVLPFTNMSGDPHQEYFSDGITDDLITALSRLSDLFVIARTSSFTYKGKAANVQEVSRELGVKYILEGSVRKSGDQVRITAQLVDATTGADLWAQHYDRPMRDVFSLQDEIVQRIVTTLNLQLAVSGHGILVAKRTDNLEAYDYLLRGLEFAFNPTKEANEKARHMFEKAIDLDPTYSDAYAWLGSVLWVDLSLQWSLDGHDLDRAIQLEQQSIALDNYNTFAYSRLSYLYTNTQQYDLSITAAERAIASDPNSVLGYGSLALALAASGEPAEALVAVHKATRLDPQERDFYGLTQGRIYLYMGRYEEAIPVLKRFLGRYSNIIPGHLLLIACYVELGRNEEARAEAAEVMRINPQFSLALQKQFSIIKEPLRDRIFADIGKAGLK